MALQIRRGTNSQRLSLGGINTPVQGEPLFTTDTKKLYIGDGGTAGGVSLGYYSNVAVEGQDTLSATNNTETLTLVAGSNIELTTDAENDSVTISASASFTELNNDSIRIFQNNITGLNSNENINIDPSGTGKLIVTGDSDIIGDVTVTGTISSTFEGDIKGSLFADSSTLIVDAINNTVTTSQVNTPVIDSSAALDITAVNDVTVTSSGNVEINAASGSIFAVSPIFDVSGTLQVSTIDSSDSSQITVTPSAKFNSDLEVDNDLSVGGLTTFSRPFSLNEITNDFEPILIQRARGTPGSLQSLTDLSSMGSFRFSGYHGSGYSTGAEISVNVDGTISGSNIPATISFSASDSSGNFNTPFRIVGEGGYVLVPGYLRVIAEQGGIQNSVNIEEYHELADSNGFGFQRGRGTRDVPETVQDGDDIIDFGFKAYDGTAYRTAASISVLIDGAVSTNNVPGKIVIRTSDGPGTVDRISIETNGDLISTAGIVTSGSAGIGYTTGAGGTVTQITSKSTGVSLDKITGEITMDTESLASDTSVSFTLTNSTIEASDHVIASHVSGGTLGAYGVTASAASGSATVVIRNLTAGALSEAVVVKFTVIKSVTS